MLQFAIVALVWSFGRQSRSAQPLYSLFRSVQIVQIAGTTHMLHASQKDNMFVSTNTVNAHLCFHCVPFNFPGCFRLQIPLDLRSAMDDGAALGLAQF